MRKRGNQIEGIAFERLIIDKYNLKESESNTALWDAYAPDGIPVSIKKVRYGNDLIFGDLFRQASINEAFYMVIGFWEDDIEEVDRVIVVRFRVQDWVVHFPQKEVREARKFLDFFKGKVGERYKRAWDIIRERMIRVWRRKSSGQIGVRARYRKRNGNHEIKAAVSSKRFLREIENGNIGRDYNDLHIEKGLLKSYIHFEKWSREMKEHE